MEGFEWGFALLGLLGIVLHAMGTVAEQGGRTLGAMWVYVNENSLTIIYSLLAYVAIIAFWQTEGLDFIGMVQGHLTGGTVIVAYASDSLFKKAVSIRTASKEKP